MRISRLPAGALALALVSVLGACSSTLQTIKTGLSNDLAKLATLGNEAATANIALANFACANYASPDVLFQSAAAADPAHKIIPAGDVTTELNVAGALKSACAGAPFSSETQVIGGLVDAWASFVAVTNKNRVPVAAAPTN